MPKFKQTLLTACLVVWAGLPLPSQSASPEQKPKVAQVKQTSKTEKTQKSEKKKKQDKKQEKKSGSGKKSKKEKKASKKSKVKQAPISKNLNTLSLPSTNASIPKGVALSSQLPRLAPGSEAAIPTVSLDLATNAQSLADIPPIKSNGVWIGAINGKQVYKLGEAIHIDKQPEAVYVKPKPTQRYPNLPPLPVIEQP